MARNTKLLDYYLSDKGLKEIKEWSSNGLSRLQIAKNMGIVGKTLYNWESKYPQISKALNEGLEVQKKELENALFKRAIGYKDTEVKIERYKLKGKVIENNTNFPVKETITTKIFPPDTGAAAFMLKCKFGWKEKSVIEMQDTRDNALSELTTEDLKKLVNACEKADKS
ncbi:MAG: hypothetical protein IKB61_01515 [Elusimicrobiaceae bacterium]|nr:hypothetical protein [Elusimicrobiaceae bacterium]